MRKTQRRARQTLAVQIEGGNTITIKLNFLAGRYHANPWGRHVREAAVEWGPSPYRLMRALIDTKFRKMPDLDMDAIESILAKLCAAPPVFHLPKATYSFIDIFKNVSKFGEPERKEEMFDAFVVVNPSDPVYIRWEEEELTRNEKSILSSLLEKINFLGRSESWVQMELCDDIPNIEWNSYPATDGDDKGNKEEIKVSIPVPMEEYDLKNDETGLSWFDGLTLGTMEISKRKLVNSPTMKFLNYFVDKDRFVITPSIFEQKPTNEYSAVLYGIESKLPPRITDTIYIGDSIHRSLMSRYKRVTGSPNISGRLSGRDALGNALKGHRHIFILPLDLNSDGVLDHVLIESKEPFDLNEIKTLSSFKVLWQKNGEIIRFVPVQFGKRGSINLPQNVDREGRVFLSETPVVLTRHYRKGRGEKEQWIKDEIKHEAINYGLPEPVSISFVPRLEKKGHNFDWIEFRRSRKGDPDQLGYGFRLEFKETIYGPFSIGYGAHYGLGLFMPKRVENDPRP